MFHICNHFAGEYSISVSHTSTHACKRNETIPCSISINHNTCKFIGCGNEKNLKKFITIHMKLYKTRHYGWFKIGQRRDRINTNCCVSGHCLKEPSNIFMGDKGKICDGISVVAKIAPFRIHSNRKGFPKSYTKDG